MCKSPCISCPSLPFPTLLAPVCEQHLHDELERFPWAARAFLEPPQQLELGRSQLSGLCVVERKEGVLQVHSCSTAGLCRRQGLHGVAYTVLCCVNKSAAPVAVEGVESHSTRLAGLRRWVSQEAGKKLESAGTRLNHQFDPARQGLLLGERHLRTASQAVVIDFPYTGCRRHRACIYTLTAMALRLVGVVSLLLLPPSSGNWIHSGS